MSAFRTGVSVPRRGVRTALVVVLVLVVAGVLAWFGFAKEQPLEAGLGPPEGNVVGASFPEFSLTEVSGAPITPGTLAGKPSLLWFTTSWCVPCQIGARTVAALQDELGGDPFSVVVVFVDPREKDNALRAWRKNFGRPHWSVALDGMDNSLAQRMGMRFLDTKYLLDSAGIIKNIDVEIVDQEYLDLLRAAVEGG